MITFEDLDKIFEAVEKIPENRDYIPTVEEMEAHRVREEPVKYLPYLIWISEMLAGTKNKKEKETNRYITDLVNTVCLV